MNRKYRLIAASMALCCTAALVRPILSFASETEEETVSGSSYIGSSNIALRGLTVSSKGNKDYPAQVDTTAAVMGGLADEIVSFAKEYQFNTLFYEISPRADAMFRSSYLPSSRYLVSEEGSFILSDPLDVLLETAEMEKINVCATVSLLYAGEVSDSYSDNSPVTQHPDWFITQRTSLYFNPSNPEVRAFWASALKEIVDKYELDGIILSGLDVLGENYADGVQQLITDCMAAIHLANSELSAGISLSYEAVEKESWQEILSHIGASLNFLMPEMAVSLSGESNYSAYLSQWKTLAEEYGLKLYTCNMASLQSYPLCGETMFGDDYELSQQLYANLLADADGYNIHSYSDINALRSYLAEELTLVPDSANSADALLDYGNAEELTLAVSESKVHTQYTSYYLSGRCDPNETLYINDEPVDPSLISEDGFWGVLLDLERGSNRIYVRQGRQRRSLNIYSSIKETASEGIIDDIQEDSVYPQENEVLYEGEPVVLSCIAPYGGSVTARFQDKLYHLTTAEGYTEEDIGKPVEYSLEVYPEDFDATQTTNLGKVSYTLSYQDFTSKYRSSGQVYLVGNSSRLAISVNGSSARVYQSMDDDIVHSFLPNGACDFAGDAGEDYYRLYSGGYVRKSDVTIVEGFVDIQRSIEAVGLQSHDQGENLIFVGAEGRPYYIHYNENSRTLTFQLYNVVTMPNSLSHLASDLFDSISVQIDNSGICTVRFRMAEGKELWGYQIAYQDGNLHLKCKTAPQLSEDSSQPLSGISVVIDPGHGGVDSGALGIWGDNGPQEEDITLAYAQSLRRRLESLGAEVYLTRSDDSTMDEYDRMLYSGYKDADFYLSFHLSETSTRSDGRSEGGLSIYYDNELSSRLGYYLYNSLSSSLRLSKNRIASDVSVTKVPLAKAVMICPGNISNPEDYERLCDPVEIYKSSCYLADALVEYLK